MENSMEMTCIICRELRKNFSISECNHTHICLFCIVKLRLLYKDNRCPVCTKKNDEVVLFELDQTSENIRFSEISQEECYKDNDYKNNKILYFDINSMELVSSLTSYKCPISYCNEPIYDTLKSLTIHLGNKHKRYYCEICVKDSKNFLSDARIYSYDELQEHYDNGEFDDYMNILVPIHLNCYFCKKKFYNDETLLGHMIENHFECTICKQMTKGIVYHKDIRAIHLHNKFKHYQCPNQECLNDYFIAYDSKLKVLEHMITKHKIKEKDAEQILDKAIVEKTDPFDNYKRIDFYEDDCFDVENYIKKLKERQSVIKKGKEERMNLEKGSKANDNQYNNQYNNQYSNQYSNKYSKNNKNNQYKDKNSYKKQESKQYKPKENDDYITEEYEKDGMLIIKRIPKVNSNVNNKQKPDQIPQKSQTQKQELKISDYPSFFNQYYSEIKTYIKNKIINESIPEKEVVIPVIVGYQLIVIISKLENKEMAELKLITNFGFGFSIVEEILNSYANHDVSSFVSLLSSIPFNKLLVLYKYLHICYLKSTNAYYKKDEDHIDEDVYDEFLPRKEKKKEEIKSGISYSVNYSKSNKFGITKGTKKNKSKIVPQSSFNDCNDNKVMSFQNAAEQIIRNEVKEKEKEGKEKEDKEKSSKTSQLKSLLDKDDEYFEVDNSIKTKSKLGQLFDPKKQSETIEKEKKIEKKKEKNNGFKKFQGLNHEDFPSLN